MKTIPNTLTQITNVGTPNNNGIDPILRLEKQYNSLGIKNPRIISAGRTAKLNFKIFLRKQKIPD